MLKKGFYLAVLLFGCLNQSSAQNQDRKIPITHIINVEPDVELHVVDWGGKGAPLLFVPSWAATSHVFDTFAPKFTDTHRVLVMNKRGHGTSSRPDHGYTIDRLTMDIKDILDSLNIEQVSLIGLSRSASLVTQFAARYPERIENVIYLSGPIDRAFARSFSSQPKIKDLLSKLGPTRESLQALCDFKEPQLYPEGSIDQSSHSYGVEWRANDPSPPYSLIKAPTLAFWGNIRGMEDLYRQECEKSVDQVKVSELLDQLSVALAPLDEREAHDIKLFQEGMVNGKVIEILGAQYYTFLSHPELVEKEMRSFLDSQ